MFGSAILLLLKFYVRSFLSLSALIVYPWLCASVLAGLEIHNFRLTP